MQALKEQQKYIVKMWPKTLVKKPKGKAGLLRQLDDLRKKISAAWKSGVSVVDEIRNQRTKPYDLRH